jgi:hypothetical protein
MLFVNSNLVRQTEVKITIAPHSGRSCYPAIMSTLGAKAGVGGYLPISQVTTFAYSAFYSPFKIEVEPFCIDF